MASSASTNTDRSVGGKEAIRRKITRRKLDMVFRRSSDEYGMVECARYHQQNDTKQLMDGMFKMPKALKDMFVTLSNGSPDKVRDIITVGYQLMERGFSLLFMDCPGGVVCKISHLHPLRFPDEPELNTGPILELVYKSRLIMEETKAITSEKILGFDFGEGGPVPPCFHIQPSSPKQKKRKVAEQS